MTAYVKFHQICTLIGSFCWKYIKFSRKSTGELCIITLNSDATFDEKLICCFKNDKNLVYFDLSPWKSPKFALWFLLCEVYNVWLKKYRVVILHDTEEWCKIWRKTDMLVGKSHEEFFKFSPGHLRVSKLGIWWDRFVQSRKCMN